MLAEERRQAILERLHRNGTVRVAELCDEFGVSEMTIRRDLGTLENSGLLRRVHGGAVSARGRSYEPPFMLRTGQHSQAKSDIGTTAAALVEEGDSIILDVGTTTLEVARALIDSHNLTIITPSLHIANLLADQPDNRLIVTGGVVRPGEHSLVGRLAERIFREFYVDKVFLGIGGIDLDAGLTEFNPEDAAVKQAMLASAKERIVVADASKFGEVAFAKVGALSDIDCIVTDEEVEPVLQAHLQERDINIIVAGSAQDVVS